MSMHNEAERLRVLAEKLDPEPPFPNGRRREDFFAHDDWREREAKRLRSLAIATPGALLGAAVDLFDFALAGKGWHIAWISYSPVDQTWEAVIRHDDFQIGAKGKFWRAFGPTPAAALIAAMEEV